jgi:histidinol-phosphate aminotransferase
MSKFEPREHLLAIERTPERHEQREGFVCLDRNERVGGISDAFFRDMLAQLSPREITAYPDAGPFIATLSAHLGFPESHIAETNGSDAALRRTFMAYLRPGGEVVSLKPSYAMYDLYTRIFQGKSRRVPYRADRTVDVDAFLGAIQAGTQLVIFARPDQPVGTAMAESDVRKIVAHAAGIGAICVVDEAYHPFFPETALPLVREFENLIVTRSFSKYPGCAGIRLGYAVAAPPLIKGLMAVRGGNEVSSLSLAIGRYMLGRLEIAEQFRKDVEESREMLSGTARELGFVPLDCATNFQHLRCPAGINAEAVVEALKRRGYLVKGYSEPPLSECVRVSLSGRDVIAPFLRELEAAMRELRAQ